MNNGKTTASSKSFRRPNFLSRANSSISAWEEAHPAVRETVSKLAQPGVRFPVWTVTAAAAVCLLEGVAMAALWWRYGGWTQAAAALALWITGGALVVGRRLIRGMPAVAPTERAANDVSLHVLGYDVNMAFIQSASALIMVICALQSFVDEAWYAGLIAFALTPLLLGTSARHRSMAVGLLALVYLAYQWVNVQSYVYQVETTDRMISWSGVWVDIWPPVAPYFWAVMLVGAVPQLQLPSVGGAGFGRFAGDFAASGFKGQIPVALASSLILVSAWRAAWAVAYSPVWLPHALFG
jgi:hypothetical protein